MIEHFINGLSGYVQESFLLAYLAVYLGGVLVSFTPCIYPLIPITVAFIGANGRGSKSRGFLMAVLYVLGMAVTYTFLGVFAALSGKLFGQIQSNPWTYFFVGNLCIIMGLSMMDLFSLRIRTPDFVTRVQLQKNVPGMLGSFLVGAASGLVIGPCTAPALAVVLGYAATQQNVAFASSLMFVFALGMGTLLILLGASAGLLAGLPRSGAWMARVSHLFGWVLLGTGEYFLINAGMLWV
ncbi:MAG: thiol:disulfide interchange protein [Deltaproteobacteria bacterium]|nr:thiol:disulfide interchange protein [Deltaproteobacteria bacterium]